MEKELFNELQESIRQMKKIRAGEMPPGRIRLHDPENEVTAARKRLQMTQAQFAALLETPVGTVRGWEQGRRQPHKTARILFRLAARDPEKVLEAAGFD